MQSSFAAAMGAQITVMDMEDEIMISEWAAQPGANVNPGDEPAPLEASAVPEAEACGGMPQHMATLWEHIMCVYECNNHQ